MRKNARWSGMNVNGLNMGGLGMSMGLRKGQANAKEPHTRNQVMYIYLSIYFAFFLLYAIDNNKSNNKHLDKKWCCRKTR